MPAQAIVPVLPTTTYKEQSEKEFERSLKYVRVQRRILKHLEKHDMVLAAKTAHMWTADSTKGRWPEPLQALRLCYYMRSLGFDTFAHIDPTVRKKGDRRAMFMSLFIANPDSKKRGTGHDHLYWAQELITGIPYPNAYRFKP